MNMPTFVVSYNGLEYFDVFIIFFIITLISCQFILFHFIVHVLYCE